MTPFRPVPADNARAVASLFAHLSTDSAWQPADIARLQPPRGFVLADAERARCLALVALAADEAELLAIGVIRSARRGGLGRALLTAVFSEAANHGATRLLLEVAVDNTPARALYAAAGFIQIGQRKGYYRRPQCKPTDALILARSLMPG